MTTIQRIFLGSNPPAVLSAVVSVVVNPVYLNHPRPVASYSLLVGLPHIIVKLLKRTPLTLYASPSPVFVKSRLWVKASAAYVRINLIYLAIAHVVLPIVGAFLLNTAATFGIAARKIYASYNLFTAAIANAVPKAAAVFGMREGFDNQPTVSDTADVYDSFVHAAKYTRRRYVGKYLAIPTSKEEDKK